MQCNRIEEVRVLFVQLDEMRSDSHSVIGSTSQCCSVVSSLSSLSDNDAGEDDGERTSLSSVSEYFGK